jgi:hypothetical protein
MLGEIVWGEFMRQGVIKSKKSKTTLEEEKNIFMNLFFWGIIFFIIFQNRPLNSF